jgi:hypothetical protein
MISLPAPAVRGLALLAIGSALVVGHVTFAAAAPNQMRVKSFMAGRTVSDVDTTGSISDERGLAENCYSETVQEKTTTGKVIVRRVHECD